MRYVLLLIALVFILFFSGKKSTFTYQHPIQTPTMDDLVFMYNLDSGNVVIYHTKQLENSKRRKIEKYIYWETVEKKKKWAKN